MSEPNAPPASVTELLRDLIRCPSVTPKTAGVLDVLEAFLSPLGFECTRLKFTGGGSYPVDNLFAARGHGGRRLLFAGHTDVVPPGPLKAWRHDPFSATVEDGEMHGRGAVDMKSGVAAFCAAIAGMVADGSADTGTLCLAITNDEEAEAVNGTARIMAWATDHGHAFDFALVGEPSSLETVGDNIKIGRRGSLNAKVTVTGVQGHVAYPERASNPLPVLIDLATALSETELDAGTARFQPSNLEITSIDTGNGAGNVIPAGATLRFNIRFNDKWDGDSLENWIAKRIASVPDKGCVVRYLRREPVSRCFVSPVSGATKLLAAAIKAETGQQPELSTGGGTSDARFIASYCPVVECGLVGARMHKIDERVPLDELNTLAAIYGQFARAYLAAPQ